MPNEFHALVPSGDHCSVLVDGGTLPTVRVETETRAVRHALETFQREHGLDAPFLRVAATDDRTHSDVRALLEFDAPTTAPAGEWIPLDRLDPLAAAPGGLAGALEQWIAELRGMPVPDSRAPWARPGWLAEAEAWIRDCLSARSLETRTIRVLRQWPLSSVLEAEAASGERLVFKAAFPLFHEEPAITEALFGVLPELAPELVAVDHARGWLLVRELPGAVAALERSRWPDAIRALAAVHRAWAGRAGAVIALGASDRSLRSLEAELVPIVRALRGPEDAVDGLRRRCAELGELGVPETLVHGDFHRWNVVLRDDRVVIFDWSDGCFAHPLFDLPTFFHVGEDADRDAILDAYVAARDDLPAAELRAAFAIAYPSRASTTPSATSGSRTHSSLRTARCSAKHRASGSIARSRRSSSSCGETRTSLGRRPCRRAPPRSEAAGCTSRRGRSATGLPS